MTDSQEGGPHTDSAVFLESYMSTPDIHDRINIARQQFESNTDAWILLYYGNASKLPQSTLEDNNRVLANKIAHQKKPVEHTQPPESEDKLTQSQMIFKDIDQYQVYYKWSQQLAEEGSPDPETVEHVEKMLEISRDIARLHFHYDNLDPENKEVVDWLIAKMESGDAMILTTAGSTTQEYTDYVGSLSEKFKSPMFILPPKDGMEPQMIILPDMFDKSLTEFDLLTHLAHERAHEVYFGEESPPDIDNETEVQRYLVFHEYIAILESQRSYHNLGPVFQKGLSSSGRKFFDENKTRVNFEIPGYRDQITTEINSDTFALYYAYKHALETRITAHMNLILEAFKRGDAEEAKELFENMPGSSPPVGDFKPVKTDAY